MVKDWSLFKSIHINALSYLKLKKKKEVAVFPRSLSLTLKKRLQGVHWILFDLSSLPPCEGTSV
jgi:hypothetical protein